MQLPIEIDRSVTSSLQVQLAAQLRQLILKGQIKPGTALPGSREMADTLRISRNTVLVAYDRLVVEGYLQTRRAAGTFVSPEIPHEPIGKAPEARLRRDNGRSWARHPIAFRGRAQRLANLDRPRPPIDFFVGRPSADAFPTQAWRRLVLRNIARAGAALTQYGDPAGLHDLRQAIADHLGPARGIAAGAEQIIIVTGIQEALNVVARLFVRAGTPVAVENPCYQGAVYTFESYGAEIIPVAVDADGLDVDQLPERSTSLLYVTPSHQFPTGAALPANRRIRLLEWADRVGAYVVEDDYDSDFRYDGPPLTAVAGMKPSGMVIYLGTFSKSIGAGLRIGYMVVPPELIEAAVTVKTILNNGHSWLDQAVLADFIRGGGYAKHLRRIHRVYKFRLQALMKSLHTHFADVHITGHMGGMHVMWHLPDSSPKASDVEARAGAHGVGIYGLRTGAAIDYGRTPYSDRSLIVGYSSLSETQIRKGIARVAQAIEEIKR